MTLNLLKEVCQVPQKSIYKKFDDLEIGDYTVSAFKLEEHARFGLKLHVYVDDFYLILPSRFADKINQQSQVDELNNQAIKLVYGGKDAGRFNRLKLDFVQVESSKRAVEADDGEDKPSKKK